jgi:hypothetical protein
MGSDDHGTERSTAEAIFGYKASDSSSDIFAYHLCYATVASCMSSVLDTLISYSGSI